MSSKNRSSTSKTQQQQPVIPQKVPSAKSVISGTKNLEIL